MFNKKVIISACLLGEYCRYDGKTKKVNEVLNAFKDYEIIPFCPESPVFGTPRERINIVCIDDKHSVMTDITNKDVTQLLKDEINSFINKNPTTNAIVLKSKSPSCGFRTTPILDESKKVIGYGNGIASDIFLKSYQNVTINNEEDYI